MQSDWRDVTLGEFVRIQRGHDLTGSEQRPGHFPVMGSAGPNGSHSEFKALGPGVVIGRSGASMGRVHYCGTNYWPHNTCMYVTDFLGNNPLFAFYKLAELDLARYNSGSAQPSLNRNYIYGISLRIPSRRIQDQIVDVVHSIDKKIDINRRINQTLEAMAQALFKSWFIDFDPVKAKIAAKAAGCDPLRATMSAIGGKVDAELDALPPEQYEQLAATAALFPDEVEESELGGIPKGWKAGTLSDFASFQNGYAFKTKDWADSGYPVVKIGNVKPRIIDLSGCSFVAHETVIGLDRFSLKRGDLLVGMTGYVGETGLVPALDSVAYLNQRVGRISTINGVSDTGYPFCLVRDPAYKAYAESKAHGSAQANVSGKDLMDYPAVVPDTRVLNIFNAQTAKIISGLLSFHEESRSLAELRDTLLPKLLSGELSVEALADQAGIA